MEEIAAEQTMTSGSQRMEFTLQRNSSVCILRIDNTSITWNTKPASQNQNNESKSGAVKGKDSGSVDTRFILATEVHSKTGSVSKHDDSDQSSTLTIHCVRHLPKRKLKVEILRFQGQTKECQECADKMNNKLIQYGRPRNLLIFINPQSGRKRAEKIFNRKVAPLLSLCGIKTNVIVTQRRGHIRDVISTENLDDYNGIVCLGGDGTLSELINSYLDVHSPFPDTDVNHFNQNTVLQSLKIPIGVIPTGSGDKIVRFAHETRSITTATLHIVLGQNRGLDVASLHHDDTLLGYSCLLVGYGLYGRMIQSIESRRWVPGWLRYSVGALVELSTVREFGVKLELLKPTSRHPNSHNSTTSPEHQLSPIESDLTTEHPPTFEWTTVEDTALGVDLFAIQVMPKGKSVRPYLGNGLGQLTRVKPCSRRRHIGHLVKLMNRTPGFYDYDFIDEHWVSGYRLTGYPLREGDEVPEILLVNCDGDLLQLPQPQLEVRIHKEMVKLFTWSDEDQQFWP